MSQSRVLCVFLKGVRDCNGQRADCNRTSHEEENFVQRDSQPNAHPKQQHHSCSINASVMCCDHNVSLPFANKVIESGKRCSAWIAFS
jgi:hypothetical protein